MQVLEGGRVLASADESGLLAAIDLRLMGGEEGSRALLWRAKSHYGGVTCLAAATHSATGELEGFIWRPSSPSVTDPEHADY